MDQMHKKTQKDLDRLEKKLERHYKQAQKELEEKFFDSIKAFDKADKEMSQKLADGEITKDQYLQWRLNAVLNDERVRQMRNAITNDLVHADEIAANMINQTLPVAYMDNVNYAAYEAESQSGLRTSFTLYSRETVERLMRDNPEVIPQVRPDIPKDERWNRQKLNSALTQGILQGDSIPHIADRLGSVASMDRNAAIRNARTYTTAAENGGRTDSYERFAEMGIKMKREWMAAIDDRTREEHRLLDGVRVDVDEPWTIDGEELRYPGDPNAPGYLIYNCRCTIVGALDGVEDESSERWNNLPDNISYEDWKKRVKEDTINETTADKIRALQETVKTSGLTSDLINKAGELFANDVHDSLKELKTDYEQKKKHADEIKKEFDKYNNLANELRNEDKYKEAGYINRDLIDISESKYFASKEDAAQYYIDSNLKILEWKNKAKATGYWEAVDEAFDAKRKYFYPSVNESARDLANRLSQVREIGVKNMDIDRHLRYNKSSIAKTVKWAYDCYPTDWIRNSVYDGQISVIKKSRGFYSDARKEMAISHTGDGAKSTAIHEIAHRFEKVVPGIVEEERKFYEKRTDGESLEWLGSGYRKDEFTRKDNFLDKYMGKDYGGYAYELISMGFEMAYCQPAKLAEDPDMEKWIYGLLTLAGG